jgi:chromosome segregation ATPase
LRIEDLEKGKMVPNCDVTPAAEHETQPTEQGIESTQNRKSEKWAVELEAAEAALEAELADFEKVRLQMADHISELEMQLESTTGECELQQQEASLLKNQVVSLVSEKEKLQSMLEQEVQQHRDVLLKLESELGAALEELETYKSTQLHLEERVGQLTGEVTVHVEANEEL